MGEEFSLEDAIIIARRRLLYMVVPIALIVPVAFLVIMSLPAKYRAQGTILVESQQIPDSYVQSTIAAYARERIQTARQRVMTQNRLLEVADKFQVFPADSPLSESEKAQFMRSSVGVSFVTIDKRANSKDSTIAFKVSFQNEDPDIAYRVANEFMTLFLTEDVRTRTTGASNTTEFFAREAERLRQMVANLDTKIADFKVQNADALPEHSNMHLDMLGRANGDLAALDRSSEALAEEKRFLETQLIGGGGGTDGLNAQLASLETRLASARATYTEAHPAIRALKDEIAAIKRQMAPSAAIQNLRSQLFEAENTLVQAELRGADEEDIVAAEAAIDSVREKLSTQISSESRSNSRNLSGVQLEGRIAVIDNRIRMNERRRKLINTRIVDLEERLSRTPVVQRELSELTRDYDNLFEEYQDVREKQQDAQLAESLEQNQQAEKFSILEPALRPDSPTSPDRPKLAVMTVFLAGAIGVAFAGAAEFFFGTLRGRNQLTNIFEEHPIAIIPYIDEEKRSMFSLPFFGKGKKKKRGRQSAATQAA